MRLALSFAFLLLSPSVALAAPFFVEETSRLGPQPCDGADEGCYTNYALLADLDGDGALDAVFPNAKGYYVKEQPAEPLVILRNDGAASFSDVSASTVGGFTGWLREIALADVDGDGDLDLAAPDAWGGAASLFINDGSGQFTDEASSRWDVTTRAGSVRFADVDDDGDADLLVGDWGDDPNPGNPSPSALQIWHNDGSGDFDGEPVEDHPLPASRTSPIDLDVLDIDGDFFVDVLVNTRNGDLTLFRNTGSGVLTLVGSWPAKLGPYSYNPTVCDVDGDGDLDIWIDNGFEVGYPQLLINDGAGNFTDETSARVPDDVQGQDDNGVVCADLDGDGDLDAVVMSLGNGSAVEDNERVLENDGAGSFTLLPDAFPLVGDATLGLDLGDLDGDGRLDVVTGQGEFGDFTNRLYLGTSEVTVDSRAPTFRAVEDTPATLGPSETPLVHFAVVDEATTDTGPRLSNVRVEWTGAGGTENIAVTFSGGDVFRAQLPSRGSGGNVTWRVCATDRAGNEACSEEKSYVVEGDDASGSGGAGGDGEAGDGCSCKLGTRGGRWSEGSLLVLALAALARRRIRPSPRFFGPRKSTVQHFAPMNRQLFFSKTVRASLVATALLTGCASEPSTSATEPTSPVTSVASEVTTATPPASASAVVTSEPAATATATATASVEPPALDPGPLPKGLRVLVIGDSFAQALGAGMKRREAAFGGKAILRGEKATFIPEWAGPNKGVAGMMIQEKPDLVVIALGGNELAMVTPEIRAPKVKELVKLIGGKPCVWVLPPLWGDKKDNGLLKVIKENSPPCRLYDSNVLSADLPRGSDKIHPTFEGQAKWADEVLEWARKERDTSASAFALKARPSTE